MSVCIYKRELFTNRSSNEDLFSIVRSYMLRYSRCIPASYLMIVEKQVLVRGSYKILSPCLCVCVCICTHILTFYFLITYCCDIDSPKWKSQGRWGCIVKYDCCIRSHILGYRGNTAVIFLHGCNTHGNPNYHSVMYTNIM